MFKSMFVLAAALMAAPVLAQDAAPAAPADAAAPAAPTMPMCSAKVTDGCQQSARQEARAMSGAQADARDARNGGEWTPNGRAARTKKPASAPM